MGDADAAQRSQHRLAVPFPRASFSLSLTYCGERIAQQGASKNGIGYTDTLHESANNADAKGVHVCLPIVKSVGR